MAVDYDLVIIGGGSGGLVVASAAAQLKAKVALVEKERLGGDCLWSGCVPSKSLIHAARVAHQVRNTARFGIHCDPPDIRFSEVMAHVNQVIQTIEPHDSPERFQGLGVRVIFGEGRFLDRQTFSVNGEKLTARAFVIATGSRPAIPPIEGLESVGYLTNEEVFTRSQLPKSLAIIGAGPVGCELGQAFHRLGCKVTMFSSRDQIMPKEDPEVAAIVARQFMEEGINILHNTRATKAELIGDKKCLWSGNECVQVDEILVAAGRRPNVESLNLEAAGVNYSKRGVQVRPTLQTDNPKIYGCGDVLGGYQFTHVAAHEAVVVLQNALNPLPFKKSVNYRVIPWATFTEPELARVGMTEAEAKKRYGAGEIRVLTQAFSGVDRALAEGATKGFLKIITRANGEILGAHLVGAIAGELIHEIVLAMNHNLDVGSLTGIHIYPTLAEINSKAALQLSKQSYGENQRLQEFLGKFFGVLRSWS